MRKQIRNTVKNVVERIAGLELVAVGRRHSVNESQLPAALIYTDSEKSERISMKVMAHELELKVEIYVKPDGETCGEDDVDDLIAKVDALVLAGVSALSGIYDVVVESIDIDADGDTDADYLMATRTYAVEYRTAEA